MLTELHFLRQIRANPEEDLPRLILADWLEEQGDPKAEFVRLQVRAGNLRREDFVSEKRFLGARKHLEQQASALFNKYRQQWVPEALWRRKMAGFGYERGCLERVSLRYPLGDGILEELQSLGGFRELSLVGLNFTDRAVPLLRRMDGLEELHLRWTQITGDGLLEIAECPDLVHLEITPEPERGALQRVQQICHQRMAAKAQGSRRQLALRFLAKRGVRPDREGRVLRVELNGFQPGQSLQDEDLWCFQTLAELEELTLDYSPRLTGRTLHYLNGLPRLRRLEFRSSRIDNLRLLTDLPGLEQFVYSSDTNCSLPMLNDAGLPALQNFPRLKRLAIRGAELLDTGLAPLRQLTQLEHLDLSHCGEITDRGLEQIAGLSSLQTVQLYGGRITEAGAGWLADRLPDALIGVSRTVSLRGMPVVESVLIRRHRDWIQCPDRHDLPGGCSVQLPAGWEVAELADGWHELRERFRNVMCAHRPGEVDPSLEIQFRIQPMPADLRLGTAIQQEALHWRQTADAGAPMPLNHPAGGLSAILSLPSSTYPRGADRRKRLIVWGLGEQYAALHCSSSYAQFGEFAPLFGRIIQSFRRG